MKTSHDPRHRRRIEQVKGLYSCALQNRPSPTVSHILKHLGQIDRLVQAGAPQWPLAKINPVDLAILRLAVYELVIDKSAPYKVIIDEAVEIAKNFGSQSSPAFINGVLGYIVKHASRKP